MRRNDVEKYWLILFGIVSVALLVYVAGIVYIVIHFTIKYW